MNAGVFECGTLCWAPHVHFARKETRQTLPPMEWQARCEWHATQQMQHRLGRAHIQLKYVVDQICVNSTKEYPLAVLEQQR